ncbi:MAG TPA: YihY/virulence factor BrkB family protein [Puia sp.]|jgi:membrane protein|nr:YihY/virulence factor BrkB family protein [Puia sp.]
MLAKSRCKAKPTVVGRGWGTLSTIRRRDLAVILQPFQEMKHKRPTPGTFWRSIRQAAIDFNNDNAFKLAASLSYSMIFAIGPLLIVVISLAGIFWGQKAVEGKIYIQIRDLVGNAAAFQIQDIIKYIQQSRHTLAGAIAGGAVLLIGATGVFTEIQGSINYMWAIQAKPKKGWLYLLISRLISFSVIVVFGFISMVSLVVNSLMDLLSDYLVRHFTHLTVYFFYAVNLLLVLAVTVLLFAIIFRILPDAIIAWRDAFIGAVFTGVLFMIGKLLISLYLGNSNIGLMYGAAASMMIILVWVYYSSIILYFGAEFTKAYALRHGGGIRPNDNAVFILKRESRELKGDQDDAV